MPGPPDAVRGAILFRGACSGCHGPAGEGTHEGEPERVPPLPKGLERALVVEVIRGGKGRMPAFGNLLEAGDVEDLAEWLSRR